MKHLFYTLYIIGAFILLASCQEKTVYYQYAHTPVAGWEKNDTLSFDIPPLAQGGIYEERLGLRIMGSYPFMKLTLIMTQTVFPHDKSSVKTEVSDTIECNLIDKKGSTNGQGVSYYQYAFPVKICSLNAQDSLHITIRHDMKREILPGISDVGLKLSLDH